jgi:retron-type reverse transcriptase
MAKIQFIHSYQHIISVDNLLGAWREFINGKRKRKDVQLFERNLMENILELHQDLKDRCYKHSKYEAFNIADPKPRSIHKATVRDRLLHHALYRTLYPFFDRTFVPHSYSCRLGKGVHNALNTFRSFGYKASKNHTQTLWVLKCDIRKFFASIDHQILTEIIREFIPDKDTLSLLSEIIGSFQSSKIDMGLPLGNLTSQLLVNVYMNRLDQWMKHKIKAQYYIRYADDFVILSTDKDWLMELVPQIAEFLNEHLKLNLHPDKVFLKSLASGVDFLGWVHFPDHRVLRTVAKRRMFKGVHTKKGKVETVQSYLGLLSHGNAYKLEQKIKGLLEVIKEGEGG